MIKLFEIKSSRDGIFLKIWKIFSGHFGYQIIVAGNLYVQTLKRATTPVARFGSLCFLNGTVRFLIGTVLFVNGMVRFMNGTVWFVSGTIRYLQGMLC